MVKPVIRIASKEESNTGGVPRNATELLPATPWVGFLCLTKKPQYSVCSHFPETASTVTV